ncbi:hypothetical protein, partial [Citrobacter freundii]|uniref:hypothetical protein n=1 Tax=Citrobacter freundii TaxID=546 RepID=UPI00397E6795
RTHQGASILAHLTPDRLKQTFQSSKFVLAKMGGDHRLHTVWLRQLSLRFTINWPVRSSLMISVITPNIG